MKIRFPLGEVKCNMNLRDAEMLKRIEENVLGFSESGPFGSAHMTRPLDPTEVYDLIHGEGSDLANL